MTDLGSYSVKSQFQPKTKLPKDVLGQHTRCGYWEFPSHNSSAGWRFDGCEFREDEGGDNDNVVCECDHLTNFAVLVVSYDDHICID